MAKKPAEQGCCGPGLPQCCNVEAIIGVDERGQMVLPKDLREKAGIGAGDKIAAVSMRSGEEISCIALIKVDDLAAMVKGLLGPVMSEIFKE